MPKVILLNAAPNAGKDTIAEELSKRLGLPHMEFKGKLFELAYCITGLTKAEWDKFYTRELKEVPNENCFGLSPRQFLIDISERMIKPTCGDKYFGKYLALNAAKYGAVVSDSGFNEEAEALCRIVGAHNVFCVRFTREGCTFEGDSRSFLTTNVIENYLDTTNDGTVADIVNEIGEWLNE